MVPSANVQELDYFDDALTENEFQKMVLYIIGQVNEQCVRLDAAKYTFKLSEDSIEQITSVEKALKDFARGGYNMSIDELHSILQTIRAIEFLSAMEGQLTI